MGYKRFFIGLIVFATIFGCKETVAQSQEGLVEPKVMQKMIDSADVLLIDVRTPVEYREGHLDESINIDFNSPTFKQQIDNLDKTKPVLLYCRSGNRSGRSVKFFIDAGFKKVFDLKGGIVAWQDEGLPVIVD